ncbi:MAG: DNA polymerase III subunit [Thermoguttaceae bacterium]
MVWQGILGHDGVVERFRRAMQRGRLAGSLLFVGPPGIGKKMFAFGLAKAFMCRTNSQLLEPCGTCESCRLFAPHNLLETSHPDLHFVSKPADKSLLPLELLIGDKEKRGRSGICYDISRTPFFGPRRVAIIDDADFFREEGANALLKILEEPPSNALLILIGTSTTKQLPTIRSRCKIIRFAPLSPKIMGKILVDREDVDSLERGMKLAKQASGSLDYVRDYLTDSVDSIRKILRVFLSESFLRSVELASSINDLIDSVGSDASSKRQNLRLTLNLALDFFREQMRSESISAPTTKKEADIPTAAWMIDRTIEALTQVDRNANMPFVIDAWCNDIARYKKS